jgi:hypothetical protein
MPCVVGQARSRHAMHGGTANHDTIDAPNMAVLRRGGRCPRADVEPAARRATREVRRRRRPGVRHRAERVTPVQPTTRQDHRPEIGTPLADTAHRDGVAQRVPEPAVQQRLDVDLALMGHDEALLRDLPWAMVMTAKPHEAHPRSGLQTVPGMGQILRLGRWDARQDIARVPPVQEVVSEGRLGTCAQASAGKRSGPAGPPIGQADRTWAFADAAARCLRTTPAGQTPRVRVAHQHGQGQALTVLAPQLARAVYPLGQRTTAVAMETVRRSSGRGAGAPAASRGREGLRLATGRWHEGRLGSANPSKHRGPGP